jgi:N-acetylglucosaminyl-diphospho-decaprenol L-rhamnosyltransferase
VNRTPSGPGSALPAPVADAGGPPAGPGPAAPVAVVVVNYESGPALTRCVEALSRERPAELVVVDNGSRDGSVDELRRRVPDVAVVDPGANLGYGAAANRGAAATISPTLLVCNSDLEAGPGSIAALSEVLGSRTRCAAVGPLIRDAGGARYPSARRFPSLTDAAGHALLGLFAPGNRFTRSYHQADRADDPVARDVDWLSGACLMLRRSAFDEVGGFDESYFMYAEDVDLCWRLGRAGWTAVYVPTAEVTHLQGVSTDAHPYRMILEHHRSLLRFAARSSTGWRRALIPLVAAGLVLRAGLACIAHLAGLVRRRAAAPGAPDGRL